MSTGNQSIRETSTDINELLQILQDQIAQEGDEYRAQVMYIISQGALPLFLTGSRVYGTPKEGSDVDFVVFLPENAESTLGSKADKAKKRYGNRAGSCFYFGGLNLIVETNPKKVVAWYEGTRRLEEMKPVSKAVAIVMFDSLFDKMNNEQ